MAGKEGAAKAKTNVWAEMVKRVGTPKFLRTSVLARNDMRVTIKDAATVRALRDLQKEGC